MKTRLLAVADIFGQDIPDVRSFRFPGEYFRVEMVRVGMGRQNIQPSGAFQKVYHLDGVRTSSIGRTLRKGTHSLR